jgi:hypothetical protein
MSSISWLSYMTEYHRPTEGSPLREKEKRGLPRPAEDKEVGELYMYQGDPYGFL